MGPRGDSIVQLTVQSNYSNSNSNCIDGTYIWNNDRIELIILFIAIKL